MRPQEIELLIAILVFVAVLFVAYRLKNRERIFDPKNYGCGPGQFFDNESYVGNIRSIAVFFLMICVGAYIDDIGRWVWHQLGEELIVSSGKEAWHQVIASVIGVVGIVFSLMNMRSIYIERRNKLIIEELAQSKRHNQTGKHHS